MAVEQATRDLEPAAGQHRARQESGGQQRFALTGGHGDKDQHPGKADGQEDLTQGKTLGGGLDENILDRESRHRGGHVKRAALVVGHR